MSAWQSFTDFHEIVLNMWLWRPFGDMTYFSLVYHFVNCKWIFLLLDIQLWNSFNFNNLTKSFIQNDILTRDQSFFQFLTWKKTTVFLTVLLRKSTYLEKLYINSSGLISVRFVCDCIKIRFEMFDWEQKNSIKFWYH